jgi:hypothetical protein
MRWWASSGEILLVVLALLLVVGVAQRRASSDWPYRLRMVRVLALLSALNTPGECLDLWEVLLVEPNLGSGSFNLAFARADRPQEVGLLLLDRPLGERAERCTAWQATGTPLLFYGDAAGEAVLTGPDGSLTGRVKTWLDDVAGDGDRLGEPLV